MSSMRLKPNGDFLSIRPLLIGAIIGSIILGFACVEVVPGNVGRCGLLSMVLFLASVVTLVVARPLL